MTTTQVNLRIARALLNLFTRLTLLPVSHGTNNWLMGLHQGINAVYFLPSSLKYFFSSPCNCRTPFLDTYPQFLKERTDSRGLRQIDCSVRILYGPWVTQLCDLDSSALWHRSDHSLIDDNWTTRICEDRLDVALLQWALRVLPALPWLGTWRMTGTRIFLDNLHNLVGIIDCITYRCT